MERFFFRHAAPRVLVALLVGSLAVLSAGCEDQDEPAVRRTNIGPVGPEESFGRILARLKRRLEHGPRRSIVSQGLDEGANETSTFSFQDQVTGEVIQPAEEGEAYRARVIIRTHSDYVHTQTVTEASEPKQGSENGSALPLLGKEGDEAAGEELLVSPDLGLPSDPLADPLPAKEEPAKSTSGGGRTQTLKDDHDTINKYDLVYEDDRWVLATEPEKESIKKIFEYALEGQ